HQPDEGLATVPRAVKQIEKNPPAIENSDDSSKAAVESKTSPVTLEKASVEEQSESQNKSVDKNAIGKILATVQQLINVSLYASINNTIGETVEAPVQKPSKIAAKVSDSEKSSYQNSPDDNSAANRQVASKTNTSTVKILAVVQELITASISASLNNVINDSVKTDIQESGEIALSNPKVEKNNINNNKPNYNRKLTTALNNQKKNSLRDSLISKLRDKKPIRLAQIPGEPFLVGVVINGREVGTLDIIEENNTLLIPLETFAEVGGFSVNKTNSGIETKTPLGIIKFPPNILKQINGLTYVSKEILQEKLDISLELNTADLTLLADLPWRGGSRQPRTNAELQPEFFAPSSGISRLRQELNILSTP
ncbi:MAG: Cna B-type, partial [Cyanobacteria bacterium J06636_27]